MSEQFRVDEFAACVQGHFVGYPLVPGAYLLGKIHAHIVSRFPANPVLDIKKVKFVAPVLPGQLVQITIDDTRWPRLGVQLSTEQGRVLEASAVLAAG
ncbi:hypothetical protein [Gilvimarinus japonicus]|uniref:ApeI dehydratase-like domain-containing protein n=1 Tax=Gilvimarinus japonicus TaxID=1796469 RepID=A0ABV7HS21_9GAMM